MRSLEKLIVILLFAHNLIAVSMPNLFFHIHNRVIVIRHEHDHICFKGNLFTNSSIDRGQQKILALVSRTKDGYDDILDLPWLISQVSTCLSFSWCLIGTWDYISWRCIPFPFYHITFCFNTYCSNACIILLLLLTCCEMDGEIGKTYSDFIICNFAYNYLITEKYPHATVNPCGPTQHRS